MVAQQPVRLVYADLASFPEDNFRRELIDGELIVTPAPAIRHQRAVGALFVALTLYAREHGGEALVAPTDVYLSDIDVVEPDVLFVRTEHSDRVEEKVIRSAPDIVIEVASPSTRRLEIVRKRELYERFAVPEYWYVDLEAERLEQYTLESGRYGPPVVMSSGDALTSEQVPGFTIAVAEVLGAA